MSLVIFFQKDVADLVILSDQIWLETTSWLDKLYISASINKE